MGLELTEIAMCLEEEFCFDFEDRALADWDGTVLALAQLVEAQCQDNRLERALEALGCFETSAPLDRKTYRGIREQIRLLPLPLFGVPRRFRTVALIRSHLEQRLGRRHSYCSSQAILDGVKRIIQERLDLDSPPEDTDHLIDDLGAG